MFFLYFLLTILLLPLMPLFFVFRRHFESRLRQASDNAQQQTSRERSFLQEHLASVIQIQLLHRERSQVQAFLDRAASKMKTFTLPTPPPPFFWNCYLY